MLVRSWWFLLICKCRRLGFLAHVVILLSGQPSELAQMATKGNLGEVVTTCERSWVQASPWGFSFRSEKGVGLSLKAKVRVLHTAQLDVTVSSNH
nr:hypothetical protein [Tanacetum cinerariifolium]